VQKPHTEGDIYFAISKITLKRVQSLTRAAAIYNVPRTTVRDRRAGTRLRSECELNLKRLTKLEEEVILQSVLNASLRSVVEHLRDVLKGARTRGRVVIKGSLKGVREQQHTQYTTYCIEQTLL
jgi:hypothetical protein